MIECGWTRSGGVAAADGSAAQLISGRYDTYRDRLRQLVGVIAGVSRVD